MSGAGGAGNLHQIQARLQALRTARDGARRELQQQVLALRELDAALAAAARRSAGPGERERLQRLARDRDAAARLVEQRRAALVAARAAALDGAATLLPDPRRAIEQMDDAVPFLLLPVRLETKFGNGPTGARELWVRIFPDDVAVALHEKALTELEEEGGQVYWKARARANALPDAADRDSAHQTAWGVLASRHGAYRAGWIARATKPTNWSDTVTDPAGLDFPTVEIKPASWTEAPRSFVLPDRFIAVLVSGAQQLATTGAPIPDDLMLGPDPLGTDGVLTRDPATGRIAMGDELAWLVSFDRAVEVGMGLRIPLTPPWDTLPIDRLLVLGIRSSVAGDQGRKLLERLLESHRFSRGLSVVPQGTPTNNTDSAKSGFTTSSATIDETFELERDPSLLVATDDPLAQADGQRLADALGFSLDVARAIPNADRADAAEAIAMNRALWAATLGGTLRDMFEPLVDDATIVSLQGFFTRFVLGRGLLPAVRVGSQPYGIVVTSALASWAWAPTEVAGAELFWGNLLGRLRTLEPVWTRLLPGVSFVGKPGDPFEQLLAVIGLQASSVEFYSRKAVSDDYLWNYMQFKATPQAFATSLWGALQQQKATNLALLPLNAAAPFPLKNLTFWREHDQLTGPVVDGDPTVPLAEDRPIRPYDTVHNYIDWLLSRPRAEIEGQIFTDENGQPIAAPRALLYQLLRHAYLAELGDAGVRFLKRRAPAVFADLPAEPPLANMDTGAGRSLVLHDLMNVDTSKIGVTAHGALLSDYLIDQARAATTPTTPAEVLPLVDQTQALAVLSELPTSRLERLFAEHVDLCSYRLDAWIQGLFGLRLQRLRQARPDGGTFIGAFGCVENLRAQAAAKVPVAADEIPPVLREPGVAVFESPNNGGYVHAPSLPQAVTAAILRNAYLTHAEPSRAGTMSINLSSSRVRMALSYLDGLRSGQDLAALLGYQLERGLHEGHPGIELDEYISVLRERFPLISRKLTSVPDGEPAEVIEARNVVNGYDLLDFVRGKSYPWGLTGLPADADQSAAIQAEVDRLADAMDALADVMLAESVHQMVQGNYARGKGVLQSITEGESPPAIEVVDTPRSGRSFTHRVALAFDPTATGGWHQPLTVRATASAPLNAWLASVLPPPDRIQWQVTRATAPAELVGLAEAGLEPIDAVLLCGERCGDSSSELERLLVHQYRRGRAVPDEEALVIDPGVAAPGGVALAGAWPLLKALKRLITRSRPLHANDFQLPSEAPVIEPANPRGYDDTAPPLKDLAELKSRVGAAHTAQSSATNALDLFMTGTVQPLLDALRADPDRVVVPAWNAVLATLRDQLVTLFRGGVSEALPASAVSVTAPVIDALALQASSLVSTVKPRLAAARALLDTSFADPLPGDPGAAAREKARRIDVLVRAYSDAAQLMLGRAFVLVPLFKLHAAGQPELAAALAAPVEPDPLKVEEWLQSLARVREPLQALGLVVACHDWFHPAPLRLVPAQLPVRAGDAWIGNAGGAAVADGEALSVAICGPPADLSAPLCGLAIDDWTEVVPAAKETTGIAFHNDRPNAQAPQALLLAVAPQLRGHWQWNDLLTIVAETFDRAKRRAVEPDQLAATEYSQVLPAVLTEFSSSPSFVSTLLVSNVASAMGEP